jgi:hypothetical protein
MCPSVHDPDRQPLSNNQRDIGWRWEAQDGTRRKRGNIERTSGKQETRKMNVKHTNRSKNPKFTATPSSVCSDHCLALVPCPAWVRATQGQISGAHSHPWWIGSTGPMAESPVWGYYRIQCSLVCAALTTTVFRKPCPRNLLKDYMYSQ